MSKTNFAHGQLRNMIDRVIRLKDEQEVLSGDIAEVYKEAKANGFDRKVMGLVVARLRKEAKDPDGVHEADCMVDVYLSAYRGDDEDGEGNHTTAPVKAAPEPTAARRGPSQAKPSHTRARETTSTTAEQAVECADAGEEGVTAVSTSSPDVPHDPITGEITEPSPAASSPPGVDEEGGGVSPGDPPSDYEPINGLPHDLIGVQCAPPPDITLPGFLRRKREGVGV